MKGGWDAEAVAWVLASRKPSLTSGASFDSPISAVSLLGPSEGSASTGPSMAWLLQNSESSSGVDTERTARNRREKEGHVCEGSGSVCVWARRCKWDVRLECVAQAGEQPWVGRACGGQKRRALLTESPCRWTSGLWPGLLSLLQTRLFLQGLPLDPSPTAGVQAPPPTSGHLEWSQH